MDHERLKVSEHLKSSSLYSEELAPVPYEKRTWNMWSLAAIWVGMAVCIPTYILASYMIKSGLSWQASLVIIGLANLVITIPMVLNGYAGVKYGMPFPVLGRASFGTSGVHIASVLRAIVACGWFGVQTWIGGLAFYSIWNIMTGQEGSYGLDAGKFICFGLFWLVNIYFIWKGTESIRWLENYSAPILIIIGIILIVWGIRNAGSFDAVLAQGHQMQQKSAELYYDQSANQFEVKLFPLTNTDGSAKVSEYSVLAPTTDGYYDFGWKAWNPAEPVYKIENVPGIETKNILSGEEAVKVQFRNKDMALSTIVDVFTHKEKDSIESLWEYILWFTAMVGFWATMSISISDITRYSRTQKDQVLGQFLGLPGTMMFYSFVGIFVTLSAMLVFSDILISEDAPWDPVSLIAKFKSPGVVIFAQIAMIIATLSTNIAANVIAPANAFSNLFPKKISFRKGGVIAGIIGIIICPWWLLDEISGILIFVSGLLGPVLGILLCDYYVIRKKNLVTDELFRRDGIYSYNGSGVSRAALLALIAGILTALIGYWIPSLAFLYHLSWFTGFAVSFIVYYLTARNVRITA
ncbi:MAG: hypothetical protein DWQ44_13415 [Bacteroidetes bacterium]|nr:MAG: hypothetical protein DWQ33_08225 [Bacteroidota bacterium]REK05736.1 MAG: hypothetical protein DWQ39_04830 [Bacteroidota bacterium]REK31958.1 MAG: hypothetical protein DWQ44_13415 [Bacteroidota bacterium]REK50023.1 MAG: hypothetical protein DWQ48_05640 [Bacteroidota bacterium]